MSAIDSLITSVLNGEDFFQFSTYYSSGDMSIRSIIVQLLTALIGAAIGGIAAGYMTWRMSKKHEVEQLRRDKIKFEFQKKLELNRDKRQKIWNLLQNLLEFGTRILEADKYAGCVLIVKMQLHGNEADVNFFGSLVEKIEFLWNQKSFMLDDKIAENIKKIKDLMFNYRDVAMQCTKAAISLNEPYNPSHDQKQKYADECFKRCEEIRKSWNIIWNELNTQMKKMKEEMIKTPDEVKQIFE